MRIRMLSHMIKLLYRVDFIWITHRSAAVNKGCFVFMHRRRHCGDNGNFRYGFCVIVCRFSKNFEFGVI